MIKFDDINLNNIKYFVSVAKHGSISKSAQSLQVTQSALSQAMKNLESQLDIKLFNRNTRGIVLTKEGKILFEKAKRAIKALKEAIIETKKSASLSDALTFKIAVSKSCFEFCLQTNFKEMVSKFPNVNFEILAGSSEALVAKSLLNNEIDMAILKTSSSFAPKEIVCKLIGKLNYVVAYNPDFFILKDKMTIDEIAEFPFIIKNRDDRKDSSWMNLSFAHNISCRDDISVINFVRQGVGIGLIPKQIVKRYNLKFVEVENFQNIENEVSVCYNVEDSLAKEVAKLIKT